MKTSETMNNLEIADLLRDVAAAYQLEDEKNNKFKIVAYERAADAIEHLSSEAKDLWDDGKLTGVAGIGPSIFGHLDEIFKTGKSKHFEEVMRGIPTAVFEFMKVPGIGVKTAVKLTQNLKLKTMKDLERAAKEGKIAALPGFGKDSQTAILKSLGEMKGRVRRHLLPYAVEVAQQIIEWMKRSPAVKRADPLGSLRRRASTIGDIDIGAAATDPRAALEHFTKYPNARRVLERGERSAAIILPGDIRVDLLAGEVAGYGALLQHFTGSKHHNVALREYALKKGMSLSDYGIKISNKNQESSIKKFKTEEEFYGFLGMEWIPPELREGEGEIQAALRQAQGKPPGLPKLIELKDVRADLQIHSNFDIETSHDVGASSMEDIVKMANELGYEYVAFTEHNPSRSKHSKEQIIDILKRKREKVEEINYSLRTVSASSKLGRVKKVFNSLEIDIMPDGSLPVPPEGLATLDFALVSIHSSFTQPRDEMTKRVLRALDNPKVKIFAHPTGRKLTQREGIDLNWEKVFDFVKNADLWIEINADPMRLDLPDVLVHEAVGRGIKLTLGTDAHHVNGLYNMPFGVYVARRGWAEKGDIINTRSLGDFEKLLGGE